MHQIRGDRQAKGRPAFLTRLVVGLLVTTICSLQAGCISWNIDSARHVARVASWGQKSAVSVRKRPKNPLESSLNLVGRGGPKPSERTKQVLRRLALWKTYSDNPEQAVNQLYEYVRQDSSLETAYAWTELAYIRGEAARRLGDQQTAIKWYSGAVAQAYKYLFDNRHRYDRNAYDPAFRLVCDIYNQSLEGMLRILDKRGLLEADQVVDVTADGRTMLFSIKLHGRWDAENISGFKFVSDFKVEGLTNQYRTYGLGVPLIATHQASRQKTPDEQFYPPGLTIPITAFFEVLPASQGTNGELLAGNAQRCVLHLYDPLETNTVTVNSQVVPLESDITTPLAYYLKDPLLNTDVFATLALLDGEFARQFRGLYMLEPFDPDKIPVVMVHGLWSSPVTWTEMFNDLRADPSVRNRYQFWFYLYPSGQPFWVSASQMRQDLAKAQQQLDPHRYSMSSNQMILVGHSMGGLVSRLQTFNSGDDFWEIVSDKSFDQLQGDEETIRALQDTVYFAANPAVQRVITLATPHEGSNFANSTTRWLSRQAFRLPKRLSQRSTGLVRSNPDMFRDPRLLTINTSVDSLSPESPFFDAMTEAERAPWVEYHNIVGEWEQGGISGFVTRKFNGQGDGVVSLDSARTEDSLSEITVEAEHSSVHQHPRSILEVRRILLQHLEDLDSNYDVLQPVNYEQSETAK